MLNINPFKFKNTFKNNYYQLFFYNLCPYKNYCQIVFPVISQFEIFLINLRIKKEEP
jgi:hypothetical protein